MASLSFVFSKRSLFLCLDNHCCSWWRINWKTTVWNRSDPLLFSHRTHASPRAEKASCASPHPMRTQIRQACASPPESTDSCVCCPWISAERCDRESWREAVKEQIVCVFPCCCGRRESLWPVHLTARHWNASRRLQHKFRDVFFQCSSPEASWSLTSKTLSFWSHCETAFTAHFTSVMWRF